MCIKEHSVPHCRASPLARVHNENFRLTQKGSRENQVRSHLGGLAQFSYNSSKFTQCLNV